MTSGELQAVGEGRDTAGVASGRSASGAEARAGASESAGENAGGVGGGGGGGIGVKPFEFRSELPSHTVRYLWDVVREMLEPVGPGTRVLDVGCGNGAYSGRLLERGCTVVGIDASESGIAQARRAHPRGRWEVMLADEDVLSRLGEAPFDLVLSTEVVEHLYDPKAYVRGCVAALKPGGRLVISTPYHGYLKNVVLSLTGHWDSHHSPLWDGGHIKYWSRATLGALLTEHGGLTDLAFAGAGRAPWMWKSMVMSGRKPG